MLNESHLERILRPEEFLTNNSMPAAITHAVAGGGHIVGAHFLSLPILSTTIVHVKYNLKMVNI